MRYFVVIVLLCFSASSDGATDRYVSTGGTGSACSAAAPCSWATMITVYFPGDHIFLNNGTYAVGNSTLSRNGTQAEPVTIEPANAGGVTFSNGSLLFTGSWITLQGLVMQNTNVDLRGNNNRIHRNTFQGATNGKGAIILKDFAANNHMDFNEITNWCGSAFYFAGQRQPNAANHIDHNYIHDTTCTGVGDAEPIHSTAESASIEHTLVTQSNNLWEYNLFANVTTDEDGEMVSLKNSYNIFRNNTFRYDAKDEVVQGRLGGNQTFENNTLINVIALQVRGDNNIIACNRVDNTDLNVPDGNVTNSDYAPGCGSTCSTPNARANTIAGNIAVNGARIRIGNSTSGDFPIAAQNTKLYQNTGTVTLENETGTTTLSSYTLPSPCSPTLVTPSMVGPSASAAIDAPSLESCHISQSRPDRVLCTFTDPGDGTFTGTTGFTATLNTVNNPITATAVGTLYLGAKGVTLTLTNPVTAPTDVVTVSYSPGNVTDGTNPLSTATAVPVTNYFGLLFDPEQIVSVSCEEPGRLLSTMLTGDGVTEAQSWLCSQQTSINAVFNLGASRELTELAVIGDTLGNLQCTTFDLEKDATCTGAWTTVLNDQSCASNSQLLYALGPDTAQCWRFTATGPAAGTQVRGLNGQLTGGAEPPPPSERSVGITVLGAGVFGLGIAQ